MRRISTGLLVLGLALAACGDNRAPADPGADAAAGADAPPAPGACIAAWTDLQRGTDADDEVWGMALDRAGGVYLAGFEAGVTGVTNIEPAGDARGVVLAFDRDGAPRWTAVLDTPSTDTVEDVAVDPASGRVYTVGRTDGAFAGAHNAGQFDSVVAELDDRGTPLQILETGDERPQHPVRLDLAPDRTIAFAGYDDTFVEGNAVTAVDDGFVAAVDGDSFTSRYFDKVPNPRFNLATDVVAADDGSGAIYVTRWVTSPRDEAGAYVEKRDRAGVAVWTTRISPAADPINALVRGPDGALYATGATFSRLGAQAFGQQDVFLARVDAASGRVAWIAQAGTQDSDYPAAIGLDAAGNIYVAGDDLAVSGRQDVFAMRFDPSGTLTSTWHAGTDTDDFITSMVVDPCGTAIVGGFSRGAMVDGVTPHGVDMFAIRAQL